MQALIFQLKSEPKFGLCKISHANTVILSQNHWCNRGSTAVSRHHVNRILYLKINSKCLTLVPQKWVHGNQVSA